VGRAARIARRVLHGASVAAGAVVLTLAAFLVLPLTQSIAAPPSTDLIVQTIEATDVPPPPPIQEEPEPETEPEPEERPPDLDEEAPPLDLAQLELALDPGFGGDWSAASLAVRLDSVVKAAADGGGDLVSIEDLDQPPRVVYQPSPILDAKARKKLPGSVQVVFVVDPSGRVEDPVAQRSSDPALERPALSAVKQWKFEPGMRNGQAVRFRMRVPITFPEGS
jgi:protein TonB